MPIVGSIHLIYTALMARRRHSSFLKTSYITALLCVIGFSRNAALGQFPLAGPSVYLTNYGSSDPGWPMTVLPFGLAGTPIDLGAQTWGLAASPDGRRVYASAPPFRLVVVIDTRSNLIVDRIELDGAVFGLAVSPDGTRMYATTYSNLAVIDTSTKAVIANTAVGLTPLGVAATPDGSKVYVTNFNSDSLSVITTKNFRVTSTVSLGAAGSARPRGIAVSPDGATAYIVLRGPVSAVARTRHGKKFLNDPPELFVYENALVRTPFNSSEDRVVIEELDPNRLRHELIGMIDFVSRARKTTRSGETTSGFASRTCW